MELNSSGTFYLVEFISKHSLPSVSLQSLHWVIKEQGSHQGTIKGLAEHAREGGPLGGRTVE